MTLQPHKATATDDEPNIRMVIIDDNAGSLELLSTALASEGLRILTAQDPEEGLERFSASTPISCSPIW